MHSSEKPDPSLSHHEGLLERFDDFKDRVEGAAIRAEYETGERETSDEEAKAHALVRVGRMTLGFIVVIIGIAALPLPGPGWLIIAGGLTILSKDVAWAGRLLRYIRKRVPGIPEDGKIPRSSMATMAVMTLAFVSASMWWTFGRGSDDIQAGTYQLAEIIDDGDTFYDPYEGILVTFTDDGPVQLTSDTCDFTLEVTELSKHALVFEDPEATCDAGIVDALLTPDSDGTTSWALGYSTDGFVSWFFADDSLDALTTRGEYYGLIPVTAAD